MNLEFIREGDKLEFRGLFFDSNSMDFVTDRKNHLVSETFQGFLLKLNITVSLIEENNMT
jgi:hypothetical protein